MIFFSKFPGAPFFLNVRILFKKVQCQSPGHVLVKCNKSLMGRSKVFLANNFRGQSPAVGDSDGLDNFFTSMTALTFSQGQRPAILKFIKIGLAVSEISQFYVLRESKKREKEKKKMPVAICPLFFENVT